MHEGRTVNTGIYTVGKFRGWKIRGILNKEDSWYINRIFAAIQGRVSKTPETKIYDEVKIEDKLDNYICKNYLL